jgi:hypothetical protein
MSINFQTLHDAIVALITVASVAVVLSAAFIAASAVGQRGRKHAARTVRAAAVPAQHPTATDDARELVLR